MQKLLTISLTIACFITLTGCNWEYLTYDAKIHQGNVWSDEQVQSLHLGMTKAEVSQLLGTPVLVSTFKPDRVDYVYYERRHHKMLKYKHLVLSFEGDRLAGIN